MITIEESEELIKKYLELKKNHNTSLNSLNEFKKHQDLTIKKLSYLIYPKISKYRSFSNFEDIKQEAYIAIIYAINSYKLNKGMFFWWAHKYLNTRIARAANKHSAIKYPIAYAKKNIPMKSDISSMSRNILLSSNLSEIINPEISFDKKEEKEKLIKSFETLTKMQMKIVKLSFGLEKRPLSIERISKKLKISTDRVDKILNKALLKLRVNLTKD